jgi:DNA polymerase-3 subunit gamma/tau
VVKEGRDFATKYRPTKWSDVVGQDHVVKVLRRKRDWKTLLFYGPSGVGKTTVARILAMWVNCEGNEDDVCCRCSKCEAIMSGRAPDYREENVGDSRTIEAMRGIVDSFMYKPVYLSKRVLVLDEVHNLSLGAQNLLLKVLEEPPPSVVIILCTTNVDGIIEPLRQRCQDFEFRLVSNDDLMKLFARVVRDEKGLLDLSDGVLRDVFFEAKGSPRRFLTLLERVHLGGEVVVSEEEKVRSIVDMVLAGDVIGVIRSVDDVIKELGVKEVIPYVVRVIAKRIRRMSSYSDIVKLYGVLNAMTLPSGLYGIKDEDKVLYQLLSAVLWVKNLSMR